MALVTLAMIKLHLGIATGDTSEDDLLNQLITQAGAVINNHINRNLEQADYTEFYAGNGQRELLLRNYPVQTVTSVYVDSSAYYGDGPSAFGSTTLLTAGVDYTLHQNFSSGGTQKSGTGILLRIGNVWPSMLEKHGGLLAQNQANAIGNIKVVYRAGYAAGEIPADVQFAACQMIAEMRRTRKFGGAVTQESYDYYNVQFGTAIENSAAMTGVKKLLSGYKRWIL